jgi:hypothetical protein
MSYKRFTVEAYLDELTGRSWLKVVDTAGEFPSLDLNPTAFDDKWGLDAYAKKLAMALNTLNDQLIVYERAYVELAEIVDEHLDLRFLAPDYNEEKAERVRDMEGKLPLSHSEILKVYGDQS